MTTEQDRSPFITVNLTPAMSGYFATLYTWNDEDRFPEPWNTGIGRYATWQEANAEGKMWAEIEGVRFIPATEQAVMDAEANVARFTAFASRVRELREANGNDLKAAYAQAKAEQTAQNEEDRRAKLEDAASDVDFWPGE